MAHDHHTPALSPNYEKTDADLGGLVKFIIGLFVSMAVVFAAMVGFMHGMHAIVKQETVDRSPNVVDRIVPPAPLLEAPAGTHLTIPALDGTDARVEPFTTRMWSDVHAENRVRLTSYGWVDKQAQVVHIPIEAAKKLAFEKGLFVIKK